MSADELIPVLTGPMIFISVLLAGHKTGWSRKSAWALGLASQLLLIAFGALAGHFAFLTHALVAGAFAYNLLRKHKEAAPTTPAAIEVAEVDFLLRRYRAEQEWLDGGAYDAFGTVIRDLEGLLRKSAEPATEESR